MFFLMQARHHPDMDATRDALRPAHRDWNRSGGNGMVSVLTGSALWAPDGTPIGHWGIVEAPGLAEVEAYGAGDPFVSGGVVAELSFTRMADGFAADRIHPRMTAG